MKLIIIGSWLVCGILPVCIPVYAGEGIQPGKVIESVTCKADPTQSYALYIPSKGNANALPIVYFFDPHGSGVLPLNKYRSLAEAYGFILAGSNNSKNGNDWSATERIWQQLSADTKARLRINGSRIYTCGFSGGAKVAGYVAIQHPEIKGVIAGGAGLPDGVGADNFGFSFTAIAGEGDMNLTELVAISRELDKTRTRHHILFFDGKHEWAPVTTMETAFAGLQLDAMLKALIPKDNTVIEQFAGKGKNKVGVYSQSNQLIKAEQECQVFISYLDGLTPAVDWFKTKAASLAGDKAFRQQRDDLQNLLVYEQNTKLGYMQHFQQGDDHYWAPVIRDLQTKSRSATPSGLMEQRLLAYLSLAFYSLSNRLIIANNNIEARRFVELYKMADPTNSEAWYFSAILSARSGQVQAAENDLLKAAECGFTDLSRLRQQPEFQSLNLSAVKRKMPIR
ncbi:MAG TPA: hypothetical protein VGN00_02280 [Puia sp.]